jgi:hypothetical protein
VRERGEDASWSVPQILPALLLEAGFSVWSLPGKEPVNQGIEMIDQMLMCGKKL